MAYIPAHSADRRHQLCRPRLLVGRHVGDQQRVRDRRGGARRLLSSFFWTYAFMQIPGGWLADRYRPRLIIATATILWGAFQALAALATGWGALLLARLGLGVAEGPVFPASGKLNAVWLPARERGRGAVLIDGGAQIFLERPSKFPSHRDLLFNPFFLPTGGTFSDLCVINVLAD